MAHTGHAISIRSPTVCKVVICTVARVHATTTARKARRRRSCHPQRDPGPPLGQPQPTWSRLGAMRRTKRRRSRACQIAPARGAQTALARRPPRRTAGRRGRPTRPTYAAHATAIYADQAGRRCVRVAAVAADSGPVQAPRQPPRCGRSAHGGGAATCAATCAARQTRPNESWATQA